MTVQLQFLIVIAILILAVAYVSWRLYRNLHQNSNPCAGCERCTGCEGCELSKHAADNMGACC